ncbi:hypothetical protein CABS01_16528 [Colletotrichum abscissum]|uniref:uncharacterized protein n=1 Tax=Colletotrichum abscissum TaxID=1671311 RepID=UPI0027D7109D|nr:uncharacterized protein CABS01_16528 [Colletotrichum abscissum]KAK1521574.1 hypothetical protein CABS01_16528 [Colletotrichum abscissum]
MSAQPSFLMRGQLHHNIDKPGVPLPTLRELGLDKFLTKADNRDSQQDLEENESPAMIHSGSQARPQRDEPSYSRPYSSSATYNELDKACNSNYPGSGRSWGLIYQKSTRGRDPSASSLEPAAQGFGKWQREQSPDCGAKRVLNYTTERVISSAKSSEVVESKTL